MYKLPFVPLPYWVSVLHLHNAGSVWALPQSGSLLCPAILYWRRDIFMCRLTPGVVKLSMPA